MNLGKTFGKGFFLTFFENRAPEVLISCSFNTKSDTGRQHDTNMNHI